MNRALFYIMFLYGTTVYGQMEPFYYFGNGSVVSSNCDGIISNIYNGWELYQTEDNTYGGVHTTNFCGALTSVGFEYLNADVSKAIFIKYAVEEITIESNQVYSILVENVFNNIDFENPNLCSEGLCQGVIVEIEVPDNPEDIDDVAEIRTHNLEAVLIDGTIRMPCIASEYFPDQKIKTFIIKIFPQGNEGTFAYPFLELWKSYNIQEIDSEFLANNVFNNTISLYDEWSGPYTVMHDPLSFPSAENPTFAEAVSDIDNTQVQDITIELSGYSSLAFQPYTDIRGALIEGSETERHNIILNLNQANVCMTYYFFEVIIEPGDELAITKANVMMNHGSCIRIEKDATFRINENSHFDYGYNGEGMIALNSGSSFILEKNASVEFNSIFSMWENPWEEAPSNIEIIVNPGNKLVFGKYASIANKSIDNRMKLVIHANGGLVDLSGLSDADLDHVIVVYPIQSNELEILQCSSQTSDGSVFTAIHSAKEGTASFVITDMSGREIEKGEIKMNSGYNTFHFNLPSSSPDVVILSINKNKSQVSRKLVLVD